MTLPDVSVGEAISIAVLSLSTVVEVLPIKVNPWSAIVKWLGKTINADVLSVITEVKNELAEVKKEQQETRRRLDEHIIVADERGADEHRARILRFNSELIRNLPQDHESFKNILVDIDYYEKYCDAHKNYENGLAVHAIANINREYAERMQRGDFN